MVQSAHRVTIDTPAEPRGIFAPAFSATCVCGWHDWHDNADALDALITAHTQAAVNDAD